MPEADRAPDSHRGESFLRRSRLGLWFCALSALGYLRVFMKTAREPALQMDFATWLWLGGSILLGVIGLAMLLREARRIP